MFVENDSKFYRMRRGKLVEIPREWLHQVPSRTTISDRRVDAKMKRLGRKCNKQKAWPFHRGPVIPSWSLVEELDNA